MLCICLLYCINFSLLILLPFKHPYDFVNIILTALLATSAIMASTSDIVLWQCDNYTSYDDWLDEKLWYGVTGNRQVNPFSSRTLDQRSLFWFRAYPALNAKKDLKTSTRFECVSTIRLAALTRSATRASRSQHSSSTVCLRPSMHAFYLCYSFSKVSIMVDRRVFTV